MIFSTSKEDFGRRDDAIRINSYTTVKRRSDVPYEIYDNYWRDVHGPLCAGLPGLAWYVQHHFALEHAGHLWPLPNGVKPFEGYKLDGMVEIGFASSADQARFKAASPLLFSDEQNIFDESVAYNLPNGSQTLLDRLPDPVPNGPEVFDRLHVHFHAAHDGHDEFAAYMQRFAKALSKSEGVLKVRLHLPDPHDNSKPDPPAPDVSHTVRSSRTVLGIIEIVFPDPMARRHLLASEDFLALQQDQAEHVEKLAAFSVQGVYTYIRDGRLTTAGLRGSRAAELIRSLGDQSNLAEVERLMKTGEM